MHAELVHAFEIRHADCAPGQRCILLDNTCAHFSSGVQRNLVGLRGGGGGAAAAQTHACAHAHAHAHMLLLAPKFGSLHRQLCAAQCMHLCGQGTATTLASLLS